MMAVIFGGTMLLWFWGSTHKNIFFATHFNAHIKKLEDLLVATADSQDETTPYKLRLVDGDKQVDLSLTSLHSHSASRLVWAVQTKFICATAMTS